MQDWLVWEAEPNMNGDVNVTEEVRWRRVGNRPNL